VQEGSHSNVLCVKNGVVRTAPLAGSILPGITRQLVLALCRDAGIPVREEDVPDALFRDADEIAIVGTTVEVTPVVELDGKPVGAGEPGPLVRVMQERFFATTGVRAGNLP
jgi:branched-subunit amino acid aminotransferase/4-amino-4-deoxychorismate lyase